MWTTKVRSSRGRDAAGGRPDPQGPARGAIVVRRARRAVGSGPSGGAPVRALDVIGAVVGGSSPGRARARLSPGAGRARGGRRPGRPPRPLPCVPVLLQG